MLLLLYKKIRDHWRDTGCTILCDSLFDGKAKSYLVFSVTCPKGTLFLKSVDISGREDDSSYLFELLESVVLETGVENVVQVITNSTPGFVYAGRHLMAKYTSLFWSPCGSHCINKILEDFGKLDRISTVLDEANKMTTFVYSNPWTLNLTRKFTRGKVLIRPRITSFASIYLSLRAIVTQKENLIHMFSSSEWLSSVYSRNPEAQVVKSLLFQDRFWKYAHEAVRISENLIRILRIVDGDFPAIGYIYEGIERAKAEIKAYYKGISEDYMPIWEIIDRRWDSHSPLHLAAAFLNPSLFYNPNKRLDPRVRNGFQEAMVKMARSDEDKIEITKEHAAYINGRGALGTDFAVIGRKVNCPNDWWAGFGYEIPRLQGVAMRVLSQGCSVHWCRWNWRTFESLHTRKREKEEMEKLSDLVFVHCNLWLKGICENKNGKCNKAVVFDEIEVDSDWFTEVEDSGPVLDDSWLDKLPFEIRGTP